LAHGNRHITHGGSDFAEQVANSEASLGFAPAPGFHIGRWIFSRRDNSPQNRQQKNQCADLKGVFDR
jgi:hypothetical protein